MQPNSQLHSVIQQRYSPMVFSDTPLEESAIELLLEAARWAPSSYNEQPWRFIVGRKGDAVWQQVYDALVEGNQVWVKDAPLLVVSVAKTVFAYNQKPNAHAWHDVGLATQNMLLQGISMDIYSHAMAGFDSDTIRSSFDLSEGFDPVAVIAFGYQGDIASIEDFGIRERAEAPRQRISLDEIVL